jgi:hypothetical protein
MLKETENKMLESEENKGASMSEYGRRGAIALSKDVNKKRAAALKAAQTMIKRNPNHFSDMSKRAIENRKNKSQKPKE